MSAHASHARRGRRDAGYSLIEVLVACAIASAIAGAAAPRLPTMMASFALQNATFQIANDLRLARQRAIATNGKGRIVFGADNYQRRREEPVGSGIYVDDGAVEEMPTGITVTSSPANPTFDSRGLVAAPYTIIVGNDYATSKTITVTAIGRVTVSD